MQGTILNIKRFSVHDGPGIRTTFFLKGCSLNCRWCHNPESISPAPEIGYLKSHCIFCGDCAKVCPEDSHLFIEGTHVLDHKRCTACGKCVEACLSNALEFYGTKISSHDACKAALEDFTFYEKSSGGVTLSGGEPLLQAEFCAELFGLLRQKNVHCAIDTSGAVSWKKLAKLMPLTDIFLYDLKHIDDQLHRENTGSSNRIILENLQRLSKSGVPIEIRIPVIPGFNADEKSMEDIAEFISNLKNITLVKLLAFHPARSKYEAVGHPDTMPKVAPPDEKEMKTFTEIIEGHCLVV